MNREKIVLAGYIVKKAYQNIATDVEDIVTGGVDINTVPDEQLVVAAHQEALKSLAGMMTHSDFSKESWRTHISNFLKKGGMEDDSRVKKIASGATDSVFDYLKSVGWF